MQAVTEDRLVLFAEMERRYEERDTDYFVGLLDHDDYVVRTRATCILVDFGGEDKVSHIARVLKRMTTSWCGTRPRSPWGRCAIRAGYSRWWTPP